MPCRALSCTADCAASLGVKPSKAPDSGSCLAWCRALLYAARHILHLYSHHQHQTQQYPNSQGWVWECRNSSQVATPPVISAFALRRWQESKTSADSGVRTTIVEHCPGPDPTRLEHCCWLCPDSNSSINCSRTGWIDVKLFEIQTNCHVRNDRVTIDCSPIVVCITSSFCICSRCSYIVWIFKSYSLIHFHRLTPNWSNNAIVMMIYSFEVIWNMFN